MARYLELGWTTIKPFYPNQYHTYFLVYKSGDGTVAIDKVNSEVEGTNEVWRSN